jgi:hypothetical protein
MDNDFGKLQKIQREKRGEGDKKNSLAKKDNNLKIKK